MISRLITAELQDDSTILKTYQVEWYGLIIEYTCVVRPGRICSRPGFPAICLN